VFFDCSDGSMVGSVVVAVVMVQVDIQYADGQLVKGRT